MSCLEPRDSVGNTSAVDGAHHGGVNRVAIRVCLVRGTAHI